MTGRSPDGSGSRPSDRASKAVSPVPASIPNADDAYRMTPHFRRFLDVVGSTDRAMAAWNIAFEALTPSDPEDAEFEVWQGDEMVAGCSGPRSRAMAEAVHYAVVYQTDEAPCDIREVLRRDISPDEAHEIILAGGGQ